MVSLLQKPLLFLPHPLSNPKTLTQSHKTTLKFHLKAMPESDRPDPGESNSQNALGTPPNYPTPLSPPLPLVSKDLELSRAMTASSRSSLYSISRGEFLYEDKWLVAVDKPQGVYCESVFDSVRKALADSAQPSQLGEEEDGTPEFHLANRLDRDTSGVMLITKSHKIAAKLVKAFTARQVSKTYIAACTGPSPNWNKIKVNSGHGRSKFGAWRVYAASDVGRALPGGSTVRDMETSFELVAVNGQSPTVKDEEERVVVVEERSSLDSGDVVEVTVRARPRSGRSHQIRLHCQYLGISILGDVKYEGVTEWNGIVYNGHQLHAESVSFEHPVTGVRVLIRAPPPSWATQATGV